MATIAVDFDDTLIDEMEDGVFCAYQGAAEALTELRAQGHKIVIYTCRIGLAQARGRDFLRKEILAIEQALKENEIPYDSIFMGEKMVADVYIDDRAIRFTGNWEETLPKVESSIHAIEGPVPPPFRAPAT